MNDMNHKMKTEETKLEKTRKEAIGEVFKFTET